MPPVDMADTLCDTPLTIGWIEEALKNNVKGSEPKLIGWSAETIGVGQGFCAYIYRVKLTWDREYGSGRNLPASVIVKVPTPNKIIKSMDEVAKDGNMTSLTAEDKDDIMDLWLPLAHSNEVAALTFLNSIHNEQLAVPKLYISQEYRKDEAGHGCLIMEDFVRGAPPSIVDGLSKVLLYQVVNALATIQAASVNEDEKLNKLSMMSDEVINSFVTMMEGAAQQFHMMAPEFGFNELFEKVKWIFDAKTMLTIMHYHEDKDWPKVLTHGDLWASNMLVEKDEHGRPTGNLQSLIDWQTAHAGFVAEDLGRVLVSSTTGELRRQETDNVLRAYYDEFRKNLARCGKECTVTLETIKDAYDYNFPYAVAFFVLPIPMMLTSPAFADESGKPAAHCVQSLMLRAKMAMEDVLELKQRGRC